MKFRAVILMGWLVMICGCETSQDEAPRTAITKPDESSRTYPLTGIVREVDAETGRVVLRHDEIPGYMPRMTMPFHVVEKSTLDDVHVGDKVSATLQVQGERFDLENLVVEEAAEPPAMVLNLKGGQASLVEAPRKLEPGETVPDFTMTTQEGQALRLSELRGKVVVLTFIFTRCPRPDFCPKIDTKFAELAKKVSTVAERENQVRLVSVSFDPEHDTPAVLADHAKLRGARPPLWQFAVASHEDLRKVARQLGLSYGPTENEIIHTLTTAIIDQEGRVVEILEGSSWTPEDVFMTIRKVLSGSSGKAPSGP